MMPHGDRSHLIAKFLRQHVDPVVLGVGAVSSLSTPKHHLKTKKTKENGIKKKVKKKRIKIKEGEGQNETKAEELGVRWYKSSRCVDV